MTRIVLWQPGYLRQPGSSPLPPARVRQGLRYAASRQQLWLPLVMMALVGLLALNFPVILPVLASHTFHSNGGTYGLLTAMLSIGSLGVGLIRHPAVRQIRPSRLTVFAPGRRTRSEHRLTAKIRTEDLGSTGAWPGGFPS